MKDKKRRNIRYMRIGDCIYDNSSRSRVRRDSVGYILETLYVFTPSGCPDVHIQMWEHEYRFSVYSDLVRWISERSEYKGRYYA